MTLNCFNLFFTNYGLKHYKFHTSRVNNKIVCQIHYSSAKSVSFKLVAVESYIRCCSSISKPVKVGIELK